MDGKISSQNLIKQFNPQASRLQASFYKPLIFDALSVLTAAGTGYAYKQYLINGIDAAIFLLVLGIYGMFTAVQVFMPKAASRRFLTLILEAVGLLVFFYNADWRMLAISTAAIVLFVFWGDMASRGVMDNGLDIHFFKTAMPALKKFTTAMSLTLVLLYASQWNQQNFFVSKDNFQKFFDWSAGTVHNFYPELDLTGSFDKFAESAARLALGRDANFQSLPAAAQDAALRKTAVELKAAAEKNLGFAIAGNESTSGVVYNFLLGRLGDLKDKSGQWFIIAWVVSVFFVIRSMGVFFYWLVSVLALILYEILISSGFLHVLGESRTHEVIVY